METGTLASELFRQCLDSPPDAGSGAEMVRSYSLSTLAGGTAINITFGSFNGKMDFAVITDAKAIPGAQDIADFMLEAMDELTAATVGTKKTVVKKKAASGRKRRSTKV